MSIEYQQAWDKHQNREVVQSLWDHSVFNECRRKQKEIQEFVMNPRQIEEGVFTCKNCNSKRTYSYTKQTRSADEPATVFVQCAQCNKKWIG